MQEQEADMLARSPITMVDRIRTPLLVAQGANDEYRLAEDEGHGFENPENRLRRYRAVERHFAEHLGGRAIDG